MSNDLKVLKIGIGQLHVDGGNPDLNLENAIAFVEGAARAKCDIVVLPECLDFGWTNQVALTGAQPIPGPYSKMLCEAAGKNDIMTVAGLTEKEGNKSIYFIFNW